MGNIHITENPGLKVTIEAAPADTAAKLFVDEDGNICGWGERAYGVNMDAVESDDNMRVAIDGRLKVAAGGTIAKGAYVTSDASGKAVTKLDDRRITIKGTDEDKISTTTYADDAVLKNIDVHVSKTYRIKGHLVVKNAHSSAQTVKFKLVAPASSTCVGALKEANKITDSLTLTNDDANLLSEQTVQIDAPGSGYSDETGIIEFDGKLVISTTAGNIDLQWAPNASVAANLSLMAESYIEIIDDDPDAVNGMALTTGASGSDMLIKFPA